MLPELTREQKVELVQLLLEKERRTKFNFIKTLFPDEGDLRRELYPKHISFINSGAEFTERAFIAGNRCGKTLTGLYELVTHCTGDYPDWWKGKKFNRPVQCWLAGDRYDIIKDSMQMDLIGRSGLGTGLIPKDSFEKRPMAAPGGQGCFGTYFIKHKSGGVSTIGIKTYQAGKNSFEAASIDVIMLDEECPMDIYVECQIRAMTTGGTVYLTFTPDSGLTDTVLHFFEKAKAGESAKFVVMVGWDDVPHLSKQMKEKLLATIPVHMRDVKTKGIPYLGSGAIYPIPEYDIVCEDFKIPDEWPRVYGLDIGWNKTAAVWGAYNKKEDCWYLYSEYYRGQAEPAVHADGIRARGKWMQGVIDPASEQRNQKDGSTMLQEYTDQGLNLNVANNAVEAGILKVYQLLSSGKLKVMEHLRNWFYEYRMYRRDDKGKIVKKNDHLMDATRYLVMSGLDVAEEVPDSEDDDYSPPVYVTGRNEVTGY